MQAQDAGLVRILCVAREGVYETLHEPPTADPHGGWCGGWELEAPGYPIRHQCFDAYYVFSKPEVGKISNGHFAAWQRLNCFFVEN